MKLMLSEQRTFPVKEGYSRIIDKGSVGEPTNMIWDDEGRVVEMIMVFYGSPGSYTVHTKDLEPV